MSEQPKMIFPQIGMGPSIWGPILWSTMHIVTLGYSTQPTEEEKQAAINFFESLIVMIPCPVCRAHYKMFLDKDPVKDHVSSRSELIYWVFMIHNKVNTQLNKPEITLEQFIQSLLTLADREELKLPPQTQKPVESSMEKHMDSMPLFVGIGLLAGIGIGAAGIYYYNKHS